MTTPAVTRIPDLVTVFRAFARLTESNLAVDFQSGEPVVSLLPLPSGVLQLRIADQAGRRPPLHAGLCMSPAEKAPIEPLHPFGSVVVEDEHLPDTATVRAAVEAACRQVAHDERFAPLRIVHMAEDAPGPNHHMMDRILSNRLEIGHSRCGNFVLDEVDEAVGRLCRLSFVDAAHDARVYFLLLAPAAQRPDATMTAGPFQLVVTHVTAGAPETECLNEDSLSRLPPHAQVLCQIMRFLLARSLLPGLCLEGVWAAPTERDADTDDRILGTREGLNASTMAAEESWRRFFVPFEAERDLLSGIREHDAWGRVRYLVQGELECLYIQPQGTGCSRFHRPLHRNTSLRPALRERLELWELLVRTGHDVPTTIAPGDTGRSAGPGIVEELAPTLLMGDDEVIFGGAGLLEERLKWERARAREGDVMLLGETCLPRIIGEDLARVKREHLADGGAPIIQMDIAQPGPIETLAKLVSEMRDTILTRVTVESTGILEDGVAFVGYPEGDFLEELSALVGLLGLRFTATFLPSMDRDALMAVMQSRYVVCNPGPAWGIIVRKVLAGPHTRILAPPLPYGFTGVRRFMDVLADAADRPRGDWKPLLDDLVNGLQVPIPASLGVTYVMDVDEVRRLALADGNFGIPAMPFLEDLGFSQTVFVFKPSSDDELEEITSLVQNTVVSRDRTRVVPFSTLDDLREALTASGAFQVVYSQMTFDRRLYACGKASFSMSDLECGLWGAHRTGLRLANRCRWEGPARFGPWVVEKGWNA